MNPVVADSSSWQIDIPFNVEYDSNPRMVSSGKESVVRYTATPKYSASISDGLNQLGADIALRVQRSSNTNVSADREDPVIGLSWQKDYQYGSYGAKLNYDEDTTRNTERLKTGLVGQDLTRKAKQLNLNWSRQLSERSSLSLSGGWQKTQYSGGSSDLTGYTDKSLGSKLTYMWNEKVSPFIQFGYSFYTPEGNGDNSNSRNLLIGVQYKYSDYLDWAVRYGLNKTSGFGTGNQSGIELNYLLEKSNLSASFDRSVSASGIGGYQESESWRTGYSQTINNRSQFGGDISSHKNKTGNSIHYKQFGLWYSYELSDAWQFRTYVNRRTQDSTEDSADAHTVGLTFTYSFHRL